MFVSSNRTIIQTQTSKTTQKWFCWSFQSSDLNPVEHEWGELKRRSCESEGSGLILDEGMVSDLVSGVLWSEPCRRWVSELKRRSCESEGSGLILDEGMVSDLMSGVLWPEPCRRWVRWTEEKKLWIWRIWSDSGWRNGLWSRVRCSLIWTL